MHEPKNRLMPVTPEFKDRLAKITYRNRKKRREGEENWPLEKKLEVVGHWLVLGNMRQAAAMCGVPYDTVRKWKALPLWAELEQELRVSENIQMDTKLSKLVDKSLEAVHDRLEHGDYIYDQKTGSIQRKPAALRDVHRVAVDMLSKRDDLRHGATERQEVSKISAKEQLTMLAQEFAKWVTKEQKPVIDLEEVEDAVYEERPENGEIRPGLQTGSETLYEQAGGSEEEGGTERGPSGVDERGNSQEG